MEKEQCIWDYRVIGININLGESADAAKAAGKLGEGFSQEFLQKEFPQEYVSNRSTNVALQCQQVIQIYGKNGWEHYQQGQLGNTAMLYFRKKIKGPDVKKLTSKEEAMITKLDTLQRP